MNPNFFCTVSCSRTVEQLRIPVHSGLFQAHGSIPEDTIHHKILVLLTNNESSMTSESQDVADTIEEAPRSIAKENDRSSFVDYVAPDRPIVRPPPKYKAWIVVLVLVYFTLWLLKLSGVTPWLLQTLHLSVNGAIFLELCLVVFVLLYAGLEVLTSIAQIKVKGQWCGLGGWMQNNARVKWVHEYNNFLVETVAVVVSVLEDGFSMFDTPPSVTRIKDGAYVCPNGNCQVVLKIEYKIRGDKVDQYQAWRKELRRALDISSRTDLVHLDHTSERDDTVEPPTFFQRVYLTFATIDDLNAYMTSPVRARLIRRLRPLLQPGSDLTQAVQRNAFVDLVGQQGKDNGPAVPKWKMWWIYVLSLYGTILFLNVTTPHYWEQWGLDGADERVESVVSVVCVTFISSYIATPFLTMLFAHWMRTHPRATHHEPWRTLEEGFRTNLAKLAVVVLFYGACLGAWLGREFSKK